MFDVYGYVWLCNVLIGIDFGMCVEIVLGFVVGDCVIDNLFDLFVDGDFVCVVGVVMMEYVYG